MTREEADTLAEELRGFAKTTWSEAQHAALNRAAEALPAIAKERDAARSQIGGLTRLLDDRLGTPCEQIRSTQALEAAEARALAAETKCDAAFAFIAKLVHMQSGQGWTRAVVRGAAANFLEAQGVSIAPGVDTTPEMIARARTQETADVGE